MEINHQLDVAAELQSKLSHDIRSKTNVILGFCEMLTEEPEATGRVINTLKRTARQLLQLDEEVRILTTGATPLSPSLASLLSSISTEHPGIRTSLCQPFSSPPEQVSTMAVSVIKKFANAYDEGSISVALAGETLTLAFTAQGTYPLRDFLRRFTTDGVTLPKKDFDAFYLQSVAREIDASICVTDSSVDLNWHRTSQRR